jgi:hypothetical protein
MGNEIKVYFNGTEYRLADPGAQAEIDAWKARAEKAERERDEARAALQGSVAWATRLESERDEAKEEVKQWRLGRARACACVSCEGPLTCAKCVPVPLGRCFKCSAKVEPKAAWVQLEERIHDLEETVDDGDHEARIKALADKVKKLEDVTMALGYAVRAARP